LPTSPATAVYLRKFASVAVVSIAASWKNGSVPATAAVAGVLWPAVYAPTLSASPCGFSVNE
jgi:hypothetical protein